MSPPEMENIQTHVSGPVRIFRHTIEVLEMIKFQHTVFALPFALLGAFLPGGWPGMEKICWILAAMVGGRSAAMAFNRIVDHRYDALNPRTQNRALPAGRISVPFAMCFTIASAALLVTSAYQLNPLAFKLSPFALLVILGYSYSKRFTVLCHLWLGGALALAPVGAWIAVSGDVSFVALLLGFSVMLWTAGFDILYSCQDTVFDFAHGLHSIPAALGVPRSLLLSSTMHAGMLGSLVWLWYLANMGWIFLAAICAVGAILVWEHYLIKPNDLSRINVAFFTLNGLISLLLMSCGIWDIFWC